MPVYFRPRVGPFVYVHRRRRRPVRPDSPAMERVKVSAAIVIVCVVAVILIAMAVVGISHAVG